ncbi:beta-xylosidase [Streptomyces sp. H10-C2]|uniref:beta-xylosidase n=1 Tax=unclassified Streptomyces TaxID=2593676 RepID=UPI0024B8C664|nr:MULTISPECIES: beta-xylosidase [unclassified Streptomyces]MDJ0341290.1 beta-xylosidase [Streptomyces sp. PH10-H1]MDJ0370885.1 beta-xylosidase [Streptomyces sp. H10-C2]
MIAHARRSITRGRRLAAVLGAAALMVGGGAVLAAPAQASTPVDFPTHCIPPAVAGLPPIDGTSTASVTVDNASPKVGDTVKVTYTLSKAAASNPTDIALPADVVTPRAVVVLAGAQTGTVAVTGPKSNPPIPGKGSFPALVMTGSFTATAAGAITLSPGDYTIHTSYVLELDTVCTVTNPPAPVSETVTASPATQPNPRTLALGSAQGDPGATVAVTGTKFTAGAKVTILALAGSHPTGDVTTATADAQGGFSAPLVVKDLATTGIVAFEGVSYDPATAAGPIAYKVNDNTPVPPGSQKLNASVIPGTLSMTQAGDTVAMTPVNFGQGGPSTGALQTVTVKDFRGAAAGWSLTGSVTDFKGPAGAVIGADKLSWTPSCTAKAGSLSACAAGSPGAVGTTGATLATTPNGTVTGGEFTAGAGLSLNVPAYSAPGTYSGVLTLTLT